MRIPKLVWLVITITVLCALLSAIIISSTRSDYQYCLVVTGMNQLTFIDPQSRTSVVKANPRVLLPQSGGLDESPDGKYVAFLSDRSLPDYLSLWLLPLRAGLQAQAILVADNIPAQLQTSFNLYVDWSPDSQHFAFYS